MCGCEEKCNFGVVTANQQLMYDKLKYIEDYLNKLAPIINNITVDVEKILLAVSKVDYVEPVNEIADVGKMVKKGAKKNA